MASNTSRNIKLGIFVTLGALLFMLAAYLIGNDQNLFQDTFRLKTKFRNVNGLQTGNNVRFSGIHVGTVKDIDMINDTTVVVDMVIERRIQEFIKTNAVANIGSDGLVGSRVLNIVPGAGDAPMVQSGDFIEGYAKLGTEQMMSTLGTTSENISLLTSQLIQITENINAGKGTLGMLIADTTLAGDFRKTIANLRETSERVSASMASINTMASRFDDKDGLAYAILKDTAIAESFRTTMKNLEESGTHIREVSTSLNAISSKLESEEGALDYLTSNQELVDQLKQILDNVEHGTQKFDENMDALRENFLFRRYFRKLEKEEEKQ
ncbi:MlaD family protein [Robertkochia flava]|uniref:MlaD family protein n=1 Tax=Robertkochia flava TaxID=3447986 RepID=UPI001CC99F56|nr:MlaD family protein [Robertkochia marina]